MEQRERSKTTIIMNNQSPEDFVKSLPVVSTVGHDITHGDTPLPQTALLSEAERNRLQKLAETGEQPVERVPASREEELTTFDDGSVFKFFPRPGSTTQCLLVDASGKQIAVVKDENMADFLCNAANLFVLAQLKHEADGTQMQIFTKPVLLEG